MKTETKTIYLYKHLKYDFTGVTDTNNPDEHAIISKGVEITFDLAPEDEVVKMQIQAIDKAIQKEKADSQIRLNAMDQRKQELLSICYEGE